MEWFVGVGIGVVLMNVLLEGVVDIGDDGEVVDDLGNDLLRDVVVYVVCLRGGE